jgi:prepilin-type N-terminal cleavage/methylation domain-containing protein
MLQLTYMGRQGESAMSKKQQNQGFTLIELSIVLVIIGLLIAGITSGAAMIKQSQLRSIINEMTNYKISYINFVSKYNAVPRDFNPRSGNLWGLPQRWIALY